jgi:hypothetical protein
MSTRFKWRARQLGILAVGGFVLTAASGAMGQVLFREDFDSLGSQIWTCSDGPIQGRTQFKGCPEIDGGVLRLGHHTYNQFNPGQYLLSQEIRSIAAFSLANANGKGLVFEARLRVVPPVTGGLVAAFFAYMDYRAPIPGDPQALLSDEIDLEFLSNQIGLECGTGVPCDMAVIAVYDDFHGEWDLPPFNWRSNMVVRNLDLTEWNVFRIHWGSDGIRWYWDRSRLGQPRLLLGTSTMVVPDQPMFLYFNFWAPDDNWGEAYGASLRPAPDPAEDSVARYEVDYVLVYVPSDADFDEDGDVDKWDYAVFEGCATGPGIQYDEENLPRSCLLTGNGSTYIPADLDHDRDVDQTDFGMFQRCLSGESIPADPNCEN